MPRAKVKLSIDEGALERIAREGMKRALDGDGLEAACPFCGKPVTMRLPQTTCPHCGKTLVPQVG